VVIESVGLVVANAVITRLSEDAATKRLTGHGDREAMKRAFAAAWTSTLEEHRRVLSDYDVNESFWKHEGAGEIARGFCSPSHNLPLARRCHSPRW
jgi:hypothetical protein